MYGTPRFTVARADWRLNVVIDWSYAVPVSIIFCPGWWRRYVFVEESYCRRETCEFTTYNGNKTALLGFFFVGYFVIIKSKVLLTSSYTKLKELVSRATIIFLLFF